METEGKMLRMNAGDTSIYATNVLIILLGIRHH
jgi:hypothetical protein